MSMTRASASSALEAAHLLDWAETLSHVDPDVIMYHAEGRIDEYVQNLDAYQDPPAPEEKAYRQRMKNKHREQVQGQWEVN